MSLSHGLCFEQISADEINDEQERSKIIIFYTSQLMSFQQTHDFPKCYKSSRVNGQLPCTVYKVAGKTMSELNIKKTRQNQFISHFYSLM